MHLANQSLGKAKTAADTGVHRHILILTSLPGFRPLLLRHHHWPLPLVTGPPGDAPPACSSEPPSIAQQLVGTEMTESTQQMVCRCLRGRPLAGHPTAPPTPPQSSASLCNPCSFPSYTSANTHTHTQTHALQHHCGPTRSPAARLTAITHTVKFLMVHGTFKGGWGGVTHMAPLHARITPYIPATLQLTSR